MCGQCIIFGHMALLPMLASVFSVIVDAIFSECVHISTTMIGPSPAKRGPAAVVTREGMLITFGAVWSCDGRCFCTSVLSFVLSGAIPLIDISARAPDLVHCK